MRGNECFMSHISLRFYIFAYKNDSCSVFRILRWNLFNPFCMNYHILTSDFLDFRQIASSMNIKQRLKKSTLPSTCTIIWAKVYFNICGLTFEVA